MDMSLSVLQPQMAEENFLEQDQTLLLGNPLFHIQIKIQIQIQEQMVEEKRLGRQKVTHDSASGGDCGSIHNT